MQQSVVDLSNCDREPIHIPGNVQNHGVLFACHPDTLIVEQVSENVTELLNLTPAQLIGTDIRELLPTSIVENISSYKSYIINHPTSLGTTLPINKTAFNVVGHIYDDILQLELEPTIFGTPSLLDFQKILRQAIIRLRRSTDLLEFAQLVTDEIRSITEFDRVMFYHFQDDLSGKIIGESINPERNLESYHGLRYPSSDIPAQARRLFLQNIIRAIPDMGYKPALMEPEFNPRSKRPLDMTHSFLRGVSPIHVEYLQNMGVGASLTLALESHGELWGLIACHHYDTKFTNYSMRLACELLANVISLQVSNIQARELNQYTEDVQSTYSTLVHRATHGKDPIKSMFEDDPNLQNLIRCDGVALFQNDEIIHQVGSVPSTETISRIWERLKPTIPVGQSVFQTSNLYLSMEGAVDTGGEFGGLVALALGQYGTLFWFRKEQVQTVNWAGNPDKAVSVSSDGMKLSPRRSFAVWTEEVRYQSDKWLVAELQTIHRFGVMIKEVLLGNLEALESLNTELRLTNAKLEETRDLALAANRAKSLFLSTMSHEFRTPLNAVIGYAEILSEEIETSKNPQTAKDLLQIQNAAKHLLSLIQDVLDIAKIEAGEISINMEEIELDDVIWSAISTSQWMIEKNHNVLQLDMPEHLNIRVQADAVRLRQVLVNLLSNAAKFTQNGKVRLHVNQDQTGENPGVSIMVSDTGVGISPDFLPNLFTPFTQDAATGQSSSGSGLGMAISRNLINNMGGDISVESTLGEGSHFTVFLPYAKKESAKVSIS